MSSNTSYGSSSSAKPHCPNCGNIIALTLESCPQCGFIQFFKAAQGVKEICNQCHGTGMARWDASLNQDYCEICSGRGFYFYYDVIDLRNNEPAPKGKVHDRRDYDVYGGSVRVQGIPTVKIIHRGKAPRPLSSLNFIGIFFCAIITLAVLWFINQITAQ